MTGDTIQHAKWERFFSKKNRIQANFVDGHPNFPAHDHEFIEVQVIVGGTCLYRTVMGDIRPHAGDAFLFRPGAWHAYEETNGLQLYNCCFDAVFLARELSWMIDHPSLGRLLWAVPFSPLQKGMVSIHLPPRDLERCRTLLEELRALSHRSAMDSFADRLGLLVQILNLLARCLRMAGVNPKDEEVDHQEASEMTLHTAVASAIRLIDEHMADTWTLASLAERVHVEPTYFVRLFHKAVGLPPMAYLAERRLELAAGLLRRTDLPVSEVGAMIGWLDANHFSRRFREKIGLSPTRYRQRFIAVEGGNNGASKIDTKTRK